MMKKWICVVLVLAMAFGLVACGGGSGSGGGSNSNTTPPPPPPPTAYELYTRASEALDNAGSMETETTTEMSMRFGEESMDISMESTIKVVYPENDMELEMLSTMDVMGTNQETSAYYKGGYYYIQTMGMKMKVPMDLDSIRDTANTQALDFSEDAVKDQSSDSAEGGTRVTFTLDGSAIADAMEKQLAGMVDGLGGEGASMSFGDISLSAVVGADETMKSIDMAFSFDMEMQGESISCDMAMTMVIVRLGGVSITFPDDLDTYMEY